jgi:hypothetical protein
LDGLLEHGQHLASAAKDPAIAVRPVQIWVQEGLTAFRSPATIAAWARWPMSSTLTSWRAEESEHARRPDGLLERSVMPLFAWTWYCYGSGSPLDTPGSEPAWGVDPVIDDSGVDIQGTDLIGMGWPPMPGAFDAR